MMKVRIELQNTFTHPESMLKAISTGKLSQDEAKELFEELVKTMKKFEEKAKNGTKR